jgi:hypothetical protein
LNDNTVLYCKKASILLEIFVETAGPELVPMLWIMLSIFHVWFTIWKLETAEESAGAGGI